METPWTTRVSLEHRIAAADLWMEFTGRKNASAPGSIKEANGDMVADQKAPSRGLGAPARGALAGGVTGAGLAGVATHYANKGLAAGAPRISRGLAALGGGTVGAGVGATLGAGYLIHKAMKAHTDASTKTGSAAESMLVYLRSHPRAAAAVGAALLATPAAAGGYLHEKARHTAGGGGKSKYEIDNALELEKHRAHTEHAGTDSAVSKLKEKYLRMKERAGVEAREDPRRAALYGALPYGLLAGTTGATLVPRLLR
jgi:hypothetical protein